MSGKYNRQKGNQFERDLVNMLKKIGYDCTTSRYSSRELDDACVDICFKDGSPFNIQAKFYKNAPNLHKELKKLPEDSKYNFIAHKRPRQGTIVAMDIEDWLQILEILRTEKIL